MDATQQPVTITLTPRAGGTIATVTISNPTSLNSLSTAVLKPLISTINSLGEIANLRAVVVTGAPCANGATAFVGGADIREMSTFSSPAEGREYITRVHQACAALRELPVPVIARVNGHALGAGLILMTAADVRVAARDALFGMPEVKRGVPSTVESALLPAIVGSGRARRLLMFGEMVDADTAERWGLVDMVVSREGLDGAVEGWIGAVLEAGEQAIRAQKRLMSVWEQVSVKEAIEAGIWEFGRAFEHGDQGESEGREMMREFVNGRKKNKSNL